jgi:hypothetical protein
MLEKPPLCKVREGFAVPAQQFANRIEPRLERGLVRVALGVPLWIAIHGIRLLTARSHTRDGVRTAFQFFTPASTLPAEPHYDQNTIETTIEPGNPYANLSNILYQCICTEN